MLFREDGRFADKLIGFAKISDSIGKDKWITALSHMSNSSA